MTRQKKKTTVKEFKFFQQCCHNIITKLGLTEWSIYYDMITLKDCYASCDIDADNLNVTINLSKYHHGEEDDSKIFLKKTAIHEVIHILLAKLTKLAGNRYITEKELLSEEESIVNILEKIID